MVIQTLHLSAKHLLMSTLGDGPCQRLYSLICRGRRYEVKSAYVSSDTLYEDIFKRNFYMNTYFRLIENRVLEIYAKIMKSCPHTWDLGITSS